MGCPDDRFLCSYLCITLSKLCDGVEDCPRDPSESPDTKTADEDDYNCWLYKPDPPFVQTPLASALFCILGAAVISICLCVYCTYKRKGRPDGARDRQQETYQRQPMVVVSGTSPPNLTQIDAPGAPIMNPYQPSPASSRSATPQNRSPARARGTAADAPPAYDDLPPPPSYDHVMTQINSFRQ